MNRNKLCCIRQERNKDVNWISRKVIIILFWILVGLVIRTFSTVYLNNLPQSDFYEHSYMHRDVVSYVATSKATEFIITASNDGHVKFWKKMVETIEFVKHYQAHLGWTQSIFLFKSFNIMNIEPQYLLKQALSTLLQYLWMASNWPPQQQTSTSRYSKYLALIWQI